MPGKRLKRNRQGSLLSFLDVVCCGFGAVILLLVITRVQEPVIIDHSREELEGLILMLERELFEIRGESSVLKRDLKPLRADTSARVRRVGLTRRGVEEAEDQTLAARKSTGESTDEAGKLLAARQSLTEEMQRLLADYRPLTNDTTVAGIPVDSEYIIFVIDTSGSMRDDSMAWRSVLRIFSETMAVYPYGVKGIQVMNADGVHLFQSFAGTWIPDSPARRSSIIRALGNWQDRSRSSPAQGIATAVNGYYEKTQKISIFVFGDDFQEASAESLIRYVDRINQTDRHGNRLVRIHGVGFPTRGSLRPARFANLMRVLCERNGGTFVALPSLS